MPADRSRTSVLRDVSKTLDAFGAYLAVLDFTGNYRLDECAELFHSRVVHVHDPPPDSTSRLNSTRYDSDAGD